MKNILRNIQRKLQDHSLGLIAVPHVSEQYFWDFKYLSIAHVEGEFKEERDIQVKLKI